MSRVGWGFRVCIFCVYAISLCLSGGREDDWVICGWGDPCAVFDRDIPSRRSDAAQIAYIIGRISPLYCFAILSKTPISLPYIWVRWALSSSIQAMFMTMFPTEGHLMSRMIRFTSSQSHINWRTEVLVG